MNIKDSSGIKTEQVMQMRCKKGKLGNCKMSQNNNEEN